MGPKAGRHGGLPLQRRVAGVRVVTSMGITVRSLMRAVRHAR